MLWRAVIQLNIVRSIKTILDALSATTTSPTASPRSHHRQLSDVELPTVPLEPLQDIEKLLIAKLAPPNEELVGELFIRPSAEWRGGLSRARVTSTSDRPPTPTSDDEPQQLLHQLKEDMVQLWHDQNVKDVLKRKKIRLEEVGGFFLNDLDRITALNYFPSDDDVLRARLKTVGVSEYKFEMEINTPGTGGAGTEWRIVDVGGGRSQRQTWVPFFDDVDAIIFLAPISAFDQVLAEDRSVNRLEDSVLLWKSLCSNPLLASVDLVLFLNKCDILEGKLKAGVKLAKYIKSYGERENDLESASKCTCHLSPTLFYLLPTRPPLKILRHPSRILAQPEKVLRVLYQRHCSSLSFSRILADDAQDTTTTGGIIASVRDMVLRQHLKQSKLL